MEVIALPIACCSFDGAAATPDDDDDAGADEVESLSTRRIKPTNYKHTCQHMRTSIEMSGLPCHFSPSLVLFSWLPFPLSVSPLRRCATDECAVGRTCRSHRSTAPSNRTRGHDPHKERQRDTNWREKRETGDVVSSAIDSSDWPPCY